MKLRASFLLLCMAIIASGALAHGDKKHVMGKIEKINSDSIVVKSRAGQSVEIKLVPGTVYTSKTGDTDKSAKLSDLTVGTNVVVHATPKGNILEADEIKFAAASAGHPSKVTPKKP